MEVCLIPFAQNHVLYINQLFTFDYLKNDVGFDSNDEISSGDEEDMGAYANAQEFEGDSGQRALYHLLEIL